MSQVVLISYEYVQRLECSAGHRGCFRFFFNENESSMFHEAPSDVNIM